MRAITQLQALAGALGLILSLSPIAPAQTAPGGSITGHVRGPGEVSVPGATVILINKDTGERKATWTDEAGNYTLANIPPGTYRLEVSLVGFRTDVREPVPVTAGRTLQVNIALVMAVGGEPAAEAAQNHVGANGTNAGALTPAMRERLQTLAMAQTAGGPEGAVGGGGSVRFSENATTNGGAPAAEETEPNAGDLQASANSFLLSGSVTQAPTPESDNREQRQRRIQEFRQMREGQQAPGFGGGEMGGPMIFMMGGGRGRPQINRVRGNIVESYSNSAFDARPYPLNLPESRQIASYHEQFGVTLGGPLEIPHLYHGKDKTSFFVHYMLTRDHQPFDSFASVPTLAERGGDFSQTVISSGPFAGTVPTIYDPTSNPSGPRQAFQGNIIPTSMLAPAAVGLLKYIPLPNLPGAVQNFHLQESLPSESDRVMGRIGHQISAKDSLNAFYFFNSSRSKSVSSFPALTSTASTRSQNLNLNESHTFSSHVVNTLLVNFSRQRIQTLNPFAFQEDVAGELGIQGVATNPLDWGLPIIGFTNFSGLNDTIPSLVRNQTVRAVDILIINSGHHNLRVGGEVRRVQMNKLQDPNARGTFDFTGYTTSDLTSSGLPVPGSGFDFADFLLGLPQTTSVRFGTSSNYFRTWVYAGFLQDDWRASPHLTFNLGLRYEYFQPMTEKYGHLSDLEVAPGFTSVSVVTGLAPDGLPPSLIRADTNNWAPRVGLAFRPWNQRSLVLRAGYGIFYDSSIYQRLVPNLANQPPFAQASTLVTSPSEVLTLENGFPQIDPKIARNTYAVDPNFRTPYGQTWNFSIEDEIARDLVLSLGYIGTKGSKLDLLLGPNPATGTTQQTLAIANAQQFTYETSGASSIYQGLQVGLRRQFHSGFSMSATYTFSKSIDDAAGVGGAGHVVAQNYLDLAAERGLSSFDARHRLRLSHQYEFPFGERHRWLNHGGMLAAVMSDWRWNGNATLQSGTPFTARVLGNQAAGGGTGAYMSLRADATGLPVGIPASEQTTLFYFNTAAFTLPPAGELGNAGRDTISGPRLIDFDMSLAKEVTLSRERNVRGEFRIQAQNIFNTPSFSGLATTVNANDFGRVTSVRNMRAVTLTVRVRF